MIHYHAFCDTCLSEESRALMDTERTTTGKTFPPGAAFRTREEAERSNELMGIPEHVGVVFECNNTCRVGGW